MPSLPPLPSYSMRVAEARALSTTSDAIDMVWPLWGWAQPDDLTVNGMLVFSGQVIFVVGYDPDAERWADVTRFTDVDVTNPGPIAAGYQVLETWILERYDPDELTQFQINLEFE